MIEVKIVSRMAIESPGQKLGQTAGDVAFSVQAHATTSRTNNTSRRITDPTSPW